MRTRDIQPSDLEKRTRDNKWRDSFPTYDKLPLGKVIQCDDIKEYDSLYRYITKSFPLVQACGRRKKFEIVIRRELKPL